jgi:hypothetical protein
MAKVTNNILLRGVSGKLGGLVIRQMRDGSIRLSVPPDFGERQFSEAQKQHQERFRQAAAYARRAARMEPAYAELARRTLKKAYNIALSDWFNPPVIYAIERTGDVIRVEASDDVLVARVHVQILDSEGSVLEEGEAFQRDPEAIPEWWEYGTHTAGVKIAVEAWDLPGNRTRLTEPLDM